MTNGVSPNGRGERTHRILGKLDHELHKEYARSTASLMKLKDMSPKLRAMAATTVAIDTLNTTVERLLESGQSDDPQSVHSALGKVAMELQEQLVWQMTVPCIERPGVIQILKMVAEAMQEIAGLNEMATQNRVTAIQVSTDALYQAHCTLFPPERMLVASGRRTNQSVEIGALFEVTGAATAGHVRADPALLSRALIAMDLSGTHLAAWIHSHPGTGPFATRPSTIDLRQHADWLRDYSAALLGITVVSDGWVRLWGTALSENLVTVEVMGEGITKEDET